MREIFKTKYRIKYYIDWEGTPKLGTWPVKQVREIRRWWLPIWMKAPA